MSLCQLNDTKQSIRLNLFLWALFPYCDFFRNLQDIKDMMWYKIVRVNV